MTRPTHPACFLCPQRLAEIFGLQVPSWAKVLVAEVDVIGKEEPLSEEKLVSAGRVQRTAPLPRQADSSRCAWASGSEAPCWRPLPFRPRRFP